MNRFSYDFDQVVDRRNQGSAKWEIAKSALGKDTEDVLAVSVADMDFLMAPEIVATLQKSVSQFVFGYTIPTDAYYEAVMHWMQRRHHWSVEKESICLAPGIVAAIYYLLYAMTQPGDGVIIQTPVYAPFYKSVLQTNRKLITNPLVNQNGRYVMDFEDLEQKASLPESKILILCSPHNPVGRVWTKPELERIVKICLEHDVFIISDEIHFDIVFPQYQHTVLATIDPEIAQKSVICTSPSKSFNIAGLQVSNIIIPDKDIRKKYVQAALSCGFHSLNSLAYPACIAAYNNAEPWLEAMLEYVKANDQYVRQQLKINHPELVISPLEATYLQWINFSSLGLDHLELQNLMRNKAKIFFEEGFIFGEQGKQFERFNLAYPRSIIDEVLLRLNQVLSS